MFFFGKCFFAYLTIFVFIQILRVRVVFVVFVFIQLHYNKIRKKINQLNFINVHWDICVCFFLFCFYILVAMLHVHELWLISISWMDPTYRWQLHSLCVAKYNLCGGFVCVWKRCVCFRLTDTYTERQIHDRHIRWETMKTKQNMK